MTDARPRGRLFRKYVAFLVVLVGVAALASLAAHGARWLAMRCEGAVQQRARRLGAALVPIVGLLVALLTVATLKVQPHIGERLEAHPWLVAFPLLALGGLGGQWLYGRRGADGRAFLASCAFLVGMLLSAALGLYPYVLPSNLDPVQGLTAAHPERGADGHGLAVRRQVEIGAAGGERQIRLGDELRPDQRDLEQGGVVRVAHQVVGQAVGKAVHRARDRHAVHLVSPTPEILDGGQQAGLHDTESGPRRHAGTNLTASPASSRLARARAASNITASVRPISCHPPGVSIG